jgi:hypothetical protein
MSGPRSRQVVEAHQIVSTTARSSAMCALVMTVVPSVMSGAS